MITGQFFFLSDQYYKDFPDNMLMRNKENLNSSSHDRPFFFAFSDSKNKDIVWCIPVSSQYSKFKKIYDKKVERYGHCNTIRFGEVLGQRAAFLIQNMCPVTAKYITKTYVDKNNRIVQIDNRTVNDVIYNAREVLAKVNRGASIVFPDIKAIYSSLSSQQ